MRTCLILLTLFLAFAPMALAQRPAGIAAVYGSVGYMAPDEELNAHGERQVIQGDVSVLSATLGLEAHFVKVAGLTGTVGVAFDFAQTRQDFGAEDASSGFTPQNVRPYARVASDFATATLGYLRDLGEGGDGTEVDLANTDGQDAVWLGLSGRYALGPVAVFGGGDAFLTQPVTLESVAGPIDYGDVYVVHGGAAVRSRMVELGVRVQYLTATETTPVPAGAPGDTRRVQVGLIPYLRIDPENDPVHFTLQLGARGGFNQEYAPFGITLGGQSVPAPTSPVSVSLRIDL